jgi:hypothetical protein
LILPKAWEAGLPTICRVPAANPVDQDLSDPASVFDFTAASRQIVGKPNSHALRAEAMTQGFADSSVGVSLLAIASERTSVR